jgi:hypothetical protein
MPQLNKEAETEKSGNDRRFEILSSAIDKLTDKLAEGTCGKEVIQAREVTDSAPSSPLCHSLLI